MTMEILVEALKFLAVSTVAGIALFAVIAAIVGGPPNQGPPPPGV